MRSAHDDERTEALGKRSTSPNVSVFSGGIYEKIRQDKEATPKETSLRTRETVNGKTTGERQGNRLIYTSYVYRYKLVPTTVVLCKFFL